MLHLTDDILTLTRATSVEALWAHYARLMAQFGFDRVIFGYTRYGSEVSLGDPQDWVVLTNQSPEYMQVFLDEAQYLNAPMLRWARENSGACSWSWIRAAIAQNLLNDKELSMLAFNQKMGVTAGYTISFPSSTRRMKGAVALTAKPGMSQEDVDVLWDENGREIMALSDVAYLKFQSLPHGRSANLTRRQREVLEYVGDGKTAQDIAFLMGLTPATIEKHLRLARETLDVATTAQAVLKAAVSNQIYVLETSA